MQFNSTLFLFCFLPALLAVYYIVPAAWRNAVLILSSILFYYLNVQSAPWALAVLLVLTVATYFAGMAIRRKNGPVVFLASIAVLSIVMVFFKCFAGGKYLPAGLSFYLFQITAYLVAVFRGKMQPEPDLLRYGTQIVLFPKLLSGPLMDPKDLQAQTKSRTARLADIHAGLQQLILGLGLKVLLANRIGGLWSQAGVVGYSSISPVFAWLSLIAYAMKLYFDFYGYSLMAMGIGRMFGFRLPLNFDDPYASRSVSEFYRRWHITLGAWFRENIYIPLGGNRKVTARTLLNLLVVWAFTGFWHGVGGNYLLWAGILVAFIILERLWLRKWLDKSHVLSRVYTVFVILISWVPFAIGDWSQMVTFLGRLFGLCGQTINAQDYLSQWQDYGWMVVAGLILATPLPKMLWNRIKESWVADILLFVLFWIAVYFIATSAQDPFMYFQY